MDHSLKIESLSHSFGKRGIFADTTFELRIGEIVGLLGRNGTGKTTLFEILFGTLKPNYLKATSDGKEISLTELNRHFSYHTQNIMLPMQMKVRNLITLYIDDVIGQDKIFHAKGIGALENKLVGSLSVGQQRYLQFHLILNLKHAFMLLDEPFSMLDPLYNEMIQQELVEGKSSKAFVITDHYYLDILRVSDRLYLLKDTKIMKINANEELISEGYISGQYAV